MSISSALRKAASKALKKLGGDVTIRRITTGSYDTATGTLSESTSDTTVKGFLEQVNQREENDLIQDTDQRLTIAASDLSFTPTTTDKVVISSQVFQIIRIQKEEQNNVAVTFTLFLRK